MSLTSVKNMEEQGIDVEKIRGDFPILSREIHGKPLVYLDLSLIHISEPTRLLSIGDDGRWV